MGACISAEKSLFDRYQIGEIKVSNRIVMAAMTRLRADPNTGIPNDLHVQYYSKRAKAGLIITECSAISKVGNSFPGCGAIYTKEQADGWKKVVQAVHAKKGKIVLQLFHAGRAADPNAIGEQALAPSPIPIKSYDDDGNEKN